MSATATPAPTATADANTPESVLNALRRGQIDESCRLPVLAFFAGGTFWLVVGTALAILASAKLHHPWLLADADWLGECLNFGRVRPAHLNAVIYGWAAQAGLGTLLWLMCRLGGAPLRLPALPLTAALIWNVAVTVGLIEILRGNQTGVEWLEFPTGVALPLFLAFGLISIWAVLAFGDRVNRHVYVSQWYLFGAVFWFPWLYSTVQVLLLLRPTEGLPEAANALLHPVRGVPHATVNWWFAHNVLGIFFTPIGLATAYYLIPKVIGRPVHSYHLSVLGFWTLALFYSWAGAHHLIGGPVPAWVLTASIVASVMMFVPVVTVAINHHLTMQGSFHLLRYSPTLRFVVFGAMAYTVVSVQGSLMALRTYNEPTHFTHHTIGHAHLGMYGFFSMVMFGAVYYIVPRLTGREWASCTLIRVHFWSTAVGIVLMFLSLSVGGAIQGLEMNNASAAWLPLVREQGLLAGTAEWIGGLRAQSGDVPFLTIVEGTKPWLHARTTSGLLIGVGHLAFAVLLIGNLLGWGAARNQPALLGSHAERDDDLRRALERAV